MRVRIHRTGDRHAGRLMSQAPEILHRREQARPDHEKRGRCSCAHPRRSRHESDEIARRSRLGGARVGVEHRRAGAADQLPSARRLDRIHPCLLAGDADRSAGTRSRGTRWRATAIAGPRAPCKQSPARSRACRRGRSGAQCRAITSSGGAAGERRHRVEVRSATRRRSARRFRSRRVGQLARGVRATARFVFDRALECGEIGVQRIEVHADGAVAGHDVADAVARGAPAGARRARSTRSLTSGSITGSNSTSSIGHHRRP